MFLLQMELVALRRTGAGGSSPPVPRGRGITPAPGVRHAYCNHHTLFRMKVEETKNSTTGTMKTIKIAAGKMYFPTAYFFVFPGCFASGWRQFYCRRPVCGSAAANSQSYNHLLPEGFLRVSLRGYDNPSGPMGQLPLHKGAFFSCFSGFFLFQREIVCQIR